VLGHCISCRKRNGPLGKQIMAELPLEKIAADKPPFATAGVDYFGPFLVKVGRSEIKRHGCIFTCLASRSVHIEMVHSLSTDSFIDCLGKFISRRGSPEKIFSDNGTNFHGAERALRQELESKPAQHLHAATRHRLAF